MSRRRVSSRSLRNEIARNLIGVDARPAVGELRDRLEDADVALEAVLAYGLAFGWDQVVEEVCA